MRRIIALAVMLASCSGGGAVSVSDLDVPGRTVPGTDPTEARPAVCDSVGDPVAIGVVTEPGLAEISGIVSSESMPGVLWAHDDSGAPPYVWAVGSDGTVLGHQELDARNVDWEDVAVGPGPDQGWWVYVADTGDNFGRRTAVRLLRFPEPGSPEGTLDAVADLTVTYPIGPADAEALLVDPLTGDAFIITKASDGVALVLRVPSAAWDVGAVEAEAAATLDFGPDVVVTAADISRDGSLIAVRTYGDVWLWERAGGEPVVDALLGRPCRAPAAAEPQGESIALDATGYVTIGEGADSVLYRYDR